MTKNNMEFIVDDKVTNLGLKIKAVVINNIENITTTEDYKNWHSQKVSELLEK